MRRAAGTAASSGGIAACLALLLALAACASDGVPPPVRPEFDLGHPDAQRRTDAIQEVVRKQDRRFLPELIELLDDPDDAVRLVAGGALRDLTGRDTGYRAYAPPEERRAQVLEWRRWYEAHDTTASSTGEGATP
jgi:HEAT repeat protein